MSRYSFRNKSFFPVCVLRWREHTAFLPSFEDRGESFTCNALSGCHGRGEPLTWCLAQALCFEGTRNFLVAREDQAQGVEADRSAASLRLCRAPGEGCTRWQPLFQPACAPQHAGCGERKGGDTSCIALRMLELVPTGTRLTPSRGSVRCGAYCSHSPTPKTLSAPRQKRLIGGAISGNSKSSKEILCELQSRRRDFQSPSKLRLARQVCAST